MKKSKPSRMSGKAAKTPDEYLAGIPEPARSALQHVRQVIRSVVPPETTEVISYRMPMFKYRGMLVAYGAFAKHCSLFPTGSGYSIGSRKNSGGIALPREQSNLRQKNLFPTS